MLYFKKVMECAFFVFSSIIRVCQISCTGSADLEMVDELPSSGRLLDPAAEAPAPKGTLSVPCLLTGHRIQQVVKNAMNLNEVGLSE